MCIAGDFIVQHITHGCGKPVGTQDDDIAQDGVIFVMREVTEAVRDGDEEVRDFIVHALGVADGENFIERQVGHACSTQGGADIGKAFRHGATDFGQGRGDASDDLLEFSDAFAISIFIGLILHVEEINNGFLTE